jgi:hypothetical protein
VFIAFCLRDPNVRDHCEDRGLGKRITIRRILERERNRCGEPDSGGSGSSHLAGFFEHCIEPWGSIEKAGCCLTQLFEEYPVPQSEYVYDKFVLC